MQKRVQKANEAYRVQNTHILEEIRGEKMNFAFRVSSRSRVQEVKMEPMKV